ncbi:hypothetical protein RJ639_035495 [Escallonia herrerae]|uniref:Reverse transcriptase RNase H-like domain-containing protein n=1 Tax=Escallonia herrerae TaxID=1293975 RepID=A0AA89BDK2_9ASTE|nr:hypothetical protein RJ639_035495 [Escallonia herrerae]
MSTQYTTFEDKVPVRTSVFDRLRITNTRVSGFNTLGEPQEASIEVFSRPPLGKRVGITSLRKGSKCIVRQKSRRKGSKRTIRQKSRPSIKLDACKDNLSMVLSRMKCHSTCVESYEDMLKVKIQTIKPQISDLDTSSEIEPLASINQGKENALYNLSRMMTHKELNYSPIKKLCLALIFEIQKLKHYFQAHIVRLVSKANPINHPYALVYGVESVLPLERQIPTLRVVIQEGLGNEDNARLRLIELEALEDKRPTYVSVLLILEEMMSGYGCSQRTPLDSEFEIFSLPEGYVEASFDVLDFGTFDATFLLVLMMILSTWNVLAETELVANSVRTIRFNDVLTTSSKG